MTFHQACQTPVIPNLGLSKSYFGYFSSSSLRIKFRISTSEVVALVLPVCELIQISPRGTQETGPVEKKTPPMTRGG